MISLDYKNTLPESLRNTVLVFVDRGKTPITSAPVKTEAAHKAPVANQKNNFSSKIHAKVR